jgi:hypothetical protein
MQGDGSTVPIAHNISSGGCHCPQALLLGTIILDIFNRTVYYFKMLLDVGMCLAPGSLQLQPSSNFYQLESVQAQLRW